MATKESTEETTEGEGKKSRKKGLVLGGGIISMVAVAYSLFLMAVPGVNASTPFDGPFVITLTPEKVQANLGGSGKSYLLMTLLADYEAYDEGYVLSHAAEPLFLARQKDALITLACGKNKEDLADTIGRELFRDQIRERLNPLLFPIHIGSLGDATQGDTESGLFPGLSIELSTMRDGFKSHALHLDVDKHTVGLDDGPLVDFDGTEIDLLVQNELGHTVYLDMTGVIEGFDGSVRVGTHGNITNVLFGDFVVQ